MLDHHERRRARQDLADRLILEYAGALPPGQVLATVLRTESMIARRHPDESRGATLCEELVRRRLTEHLTWPHRRATA